jgi:hypothetical protein
MPVIADALWPKPKRRKKRAITEEEHLLVVEAEKNHEQRDYYEISGPRSIATEIAMLTAENVNRKLMLLIYQRCKRRADDPHHVAHRHKTQGVARSIAAARSALPEHPAGRLPLPSVSPKRVLKLLPLAGEWECRWRLSKSISVR